MGSTTRGKPVELETVSEVADKPWVDEFADFDDILEVINPQGRFQKRFLYGLICPLSIAFALGNAYVFMVYIPDHWCHDPNWNNTFSTYEEWKNATIPREIGAEGEEGFSKCEMYVDQSRVNRSKCVHGWKYDQSELWMTIPSQFDWVCDQQHYTTVVFTSSWIAAIFGKFLIGPLVDKYGRKAVFIWSAVADNLSAILFLFTPAYFIPYVLVGMFMGFVFTRPPNIILLELSDSEFRSWTCATDFAVYVIGLSAVPLIAYLLSDWFLIGLATTLPKTIVFFILIYMFYIPESPRWLTSVGRVAEAKEVIQRVAQVNKTADKLTDDQLETALQGFVDRQNKEPPTSALTGFWTLLSKPRLAKNAIMLAIVMTANNFVYSGITINTPYMPGNQFVTFFILAIVELPSSIVGGYMMQVFGRRWTPVIFLALSTVACLTAAWNINSTLLVTLCIVASKFAVNLTILVGDVQTVETFPTVLRATGASFVSVAVQIGGVIMPTIVNMGRTDARIPYLAFGICSLAGMICAALLPETLNQNLPESVVAANDFGKDHPFWSLRPKRISRRRKFGPMTSIRHLHSTRSRNASRRRESVVAYVSQVHPTIYRERSRSIIGFGGSGNM